jgi:hypothetical protein
VKQPKQIWVLRALSRYGDRFGNVQYSELAVTFCRICDFTETSLRAVLDELEANRLVLKDGDSHRGIHYSLTFDGRDKVRRDENPDLYGADRHAA